MRTNNKTTVFSVLALLILPAPPNSQNGYQTAYDTVNNVTVVVAGGETRVYRYRNHGSEFALKEGLQPSRRAGRTHE